MKTSSGILLRETSIKGCYELQPNLKKDERGSFVKTFHKDDFEALNLEVDFAEEYYSVSHQKVLRGLHFQIPPHDHVKMVYCLLGEIQDVVVDLRMDSPSYGKYEILTLSSEIANMVYLPKGTAHGFLTLSESAIVMYKVTKTYAPDFDRGVLWNSLNIPWQEKNPVLSERDRSFQPLEKFQSPFIAQGSPG
ncbi:MULTISPECIES: dTDP-4-dehydrorhamnose 3,5-epimerase [Spirulina sp. CCY15215]|uniref:dTDP-4-dehydrorhamnose 3,5-epimerase n=1 Tax=Spirulina sp. CCY15215 TaxID=2767591 RepID=UPI001951C982